jgi:hypothetical protein
MREKKAHTIIGTIVGVFDGALDGVQAQLIRRTKLGYTVKLIESKNAFRKGDIVHLSVAEFQIQKEAIHSYTSDPDNLKGLLRHA